MAADGSTAHPQLGERDGGALVQRLPDDTAVAVGASLSRSWVDRQLQSLSGLYGGLSKHQAMPELSTATGLDLPGDLETLVGHGVRVVGRQGLRPRGRAEQHDRHRAARRGDGQGRPVAIGRVLDKLRTKTPATWRPGLGLGRRPRGDRTRRRLPPSSAAAAATWVTTAPSAAWFPTPATPARCLPDVDALEPRCARPSRSDARVARQPHALRALGWSTWSDRRGEPLLLPEPPPTSSVTSGCGDLGRGQGGNTRMVRSSAAQHVGDHAQPVRRPPPRAGPVAGPGSAARGRQGPGEVGRVPRQAAVRRLPVESQQRLAVGLEGRSSGASRPRSAPHVVLGQPDHLARPGRRRWCRGAPARSRSSPTATRSKVPSAWASTSVIFSRHPTRNSHWAPCSPTS